MALFFLGDFGQYRCYKLRKKEVVAAQEEAYAFKNQMLHLVYEPEDFIGQYRRCKLY